MSSNISKKKRTNEVYIKYKATRTIVDRGEAKGSNLEYDSRDHGSGDIPGEEIIARNETDVDVINSIAKEYVEDLIISEYFYEDWMGSAKDNVVMTTEYDGLYSWTWDFEVVEDTYGCKMRCKGSVDIFNTEPDLLTAPKKTKVEPEGDSEGIEVQWTKPTTTNNMYLKYNLTREIKEFHQDCYTDCMDCEIEMVEEHYRSSLNQSVTGKKVIDGDAADVGIINGIAKRQVKKLIWEDLDEYWMDRDPDNYVVLSKGKDGLYRWTWDFCAEESSYECEMQCKGSVHIISKDK